MTALLRNPFFRYGLLIAAAVLATVLIFPGFTTNLFRADQFMPHATCYLRNPRIILLHVSSDILIGSSYLAISITLSYLVYRASKDIPFHWMFLAFGLFIVTCGFTHFMEVWTVWQAVYWLAGYMKLICAVASVVTAFALVPLVPKIFALISAVKVSEERRARLEVANADLEAFAYSVSHDLRAPLRTIHGMATVLEEDHGPALTPAVRSHLSRITESAERMDRLILDLLEYSRISSKPFELGTVDLGHAVMLAQDAIAADVQASGAEFHLPEHLPAVIANETLLIQVLTNLFSNAVKFVPEGRKPRIEVSVKDMGLRWRVCVRDNGIGIAPEYQGKIFRIFERLHGNQQYPGSGIGLAIVQKAILRMNGDLGLESTPDEGSTFWMDLQKSEPK